MPSITSSGIGSGLDVTSLVQQLVTAEGQPAARRIDTQEAKVQGELSAFGTIKSALSQFRDKLESMRDLNTFLTRKAASGDEDLFTVSADETATPGRFAVEVVNLASAQKLTSAAFVDADTAVGTGDLTIGVGSAAFLVNVSSDNSTLGGIRDAINSAPDNTGVTASIVNGADGSYLILSGENTGSENAITITQSGGDGGLAALEYDPLNALTSLTEAQPAADALIRIDGFDITSSTNTVSGAIDGVTIELHDEGASSTLQIENDDDEVKNTIQAFVDSYNEVVSTIDQVTAYDADNDSAGALLGDSGMRNIGNQLRRELSTRVGEVTAKFGALRDIGIDIELDGKMKIVDSDLDEALNTGFSQVGQVFAGSNGVATRMFERIDGFLSSSGIIEVRSSGLEQSIERFSDQRDRLDERMASLEARLTRQFNALDTLVGQLSSTSTFLSQQLANLPGSSRSGG